MLFRCYLAYLKLKFMTSPRTCRPWTVIRTDECKFTGMAYIIKCFTCHRWGSPVVSLLVTYVIGIYGAIWLNTPNWANESCLIVLWARAHRKNQKFASSNSSFSFTSLCINFSLLLFVVAQKSQRIRIDLFAREIMVRDAFDVCLNAPSYTRHSKYFCRWMSENSSEYREIIL
jgi:hypothetical protein